MNTFLVDKRCLVSIPVYVRASNKSEALLMVNDGLGVVYEDAYDIEEVYPMEDWTITEIDPEDIPDMVTDSFEDGLNFVEDFSDYYDDFEEDSSWDYE